jgi:hypothetical protein
METGSTKAGMTRPDQDLGRRQAGQDWHVLAPVSAPPVWIVSPRSARTRLGSDTTFRSVKKDF